LFHKIGPRLTNGGYGIVSRNQTKLFPLSQKMVLGSTGCWADVLTLTKLLEARIQVSGANPTITSCNASVVKMQRSQ
jgi:20S proteasome alpha/beta subunit